MVGRLGLAAVQLQLWGWMVWQTMVLVAVAKKNKSLGKRQGLRVISG